MTKEKVRPCAVFVLKPEDDDKNELAAQVNSLSTMSKLFKDDSAFQQELVAFNNELRRALGVDLVLTSCCDPREEAVTVWLFPLKAGTIAYPLESDDEGFFIEALSDDIVGVDFTHLGIPPQL